MGAKRRKKEESCKLQRRRRKHFKSFKPIKHTLGATLHGATDLG